MIPRPIRARPNHPEGSSRHSQSRRWAGAVGILAACLALLGTEDRVQALRAPTPVGPAQQLGPGGRRDLFEGGVDWLNTAKPISSQDLIGKIVLLDFWTYCCINCHHVIPDLERLEEKYRNELVVIGVHSPKFEAERDSENIRKKVREYEIKHPVVNDANMVLWRRFGVQAWPTIVLIDPLGNPVYRQGGEGQFEALDRALRALIRRHKPKGEIDPTPFVVYAESDKPSDGPLLFPGKILADPESDRLFISDTGHNRIVVSDRAGQVLFTIGGSGQGLKDGSFGDAQFNRPQGLCLVGDTLYVADTENHAVRAVDLAERRVTTVVGTGRQSRRRQGAAPATGASLNSPWDLAKELDKNTLIIAMAGPHQLWKLDLDRNAIKVWAGSGREDILDGSLESAAFAQPSGLALQGDTLFVADSEGSCVRAVAIEEERVVTLVGQHDLPLGQSLFSFGDVDGRAEQVRLQHPLGLAFAEGTLYIADTYNNKIKFCDPGNREVRTLVGPKEPGASDAPARFDQPGGVSVAAGILYVADTNNHAIRTVDLETRAVSTLEITGLEPPEPPAEPPSFDLAVPIEAPAASVAPGESFTIEIDLTIPGFKLQPESPVLYLVEAPDAPVRLGESVSPTGSRVIPEEGTIRVPITLAQAAQDGDSLAIRLSISSFACAEQGGFCTLKQYSWTLPIQFERGAAPTVRLSTAGAPTSASSRDGSSG